MEVFGLSIEGSLKPNIRILAFPVILVIIVVVLAFIIGQRGITQITTSLKDLRDIEATSNAYEARVNSLEKIGEVVIDQTDTTLVALPEKNPSLIMIYQLNRLADNYSLDLSSIGTNSGSPIGQIQKGQITFVVGGGSRDVIDFMKEIKRITPLSTVDLVDMKTEGETTQASMQITIYWSGFPTELPPISQPIVELSRGEQKLVELLSQLTKPEFITLSPSEPSTREDPFN